MTSALVLNFFPAFNPASSGGELRIGKLYRAVSVDVRVTMLTSTDFGARYEDIVHSECLRELRFPKDDLWREAYATLERSGVHGDLSGLAFALAVSDPRCLLRQKARDLAKTVDVVIHEFPFSEPVFSDGCPTREIYNSHNFETSLLPSIISGDGFDIALLKLMRLEGNLVARAERVFATSSTDADKFRLFYGVTQEKLGACPNGFDEVELQPVVAAREAMTSDPTRRPQLLFTGSGHYPNIEAAQFLITIAQDLPDCDIVLAGGLCGALAGAALPFNVRSMGPFDQAAKLQLLTDADLFLNPVTLGSGTSLKALEALGAGLAMVSTPEGVRGLDLVSGNHCEICPREGFAAAVKRMLGDGTQRRAIARSGLATAVERLSWARIAQTFVSSLWDRPKPVPPSVPLVLALNDYPVMQQGSGGVARVRNLLTEIKCDVVLLSFGATFDVGLIAPDVLHVVVPKSKAHQALEQAVNANQPVSVNDAVASLFASTNRVMTTIVSAIAKRAQGVIFEHPYMAPLLDDIALVNRSLPVIYSAHNVEATHKRAILASHTMATSLVEFIAEMEGRLVAIASLIVCCTEADFQHFAPAGRPLLIVPNGCTVPELDRSIRHGIDALDRKPRIGFMGSGHGPNVEAAEFIVQILAPTFPDADFEFIGSICDALCAPLPTNLRLHGLLSESAKTQVMSMWDVALNPIESGGGSSLKLPDFMAHGLPSLNTSAGARGFAVIEHAAGCVVDRTEFADGLRAMLGQPALLDQQGKNARRYASDTLSWGAVVRTYRERIRQILLPQAIQVSEPKILVVTYRYTEPSLGGAEEYLIEILKRWRPRCERLDLVAIDIEDLTNQHHFSCRYSVPAVSHPRRIAELFDQLYLFAPDTPSEADVLYRCRDLERAWTREEQDLFANFVSTLAAPGRLRVFAGFYWPENHGGLIRRWTSPTFSFLVPPAARVFRMAGFASTRKNMRLFLARIAPDGSFEVISTMTAKVGPYLSIEVALPRLDEAGPTVLICEVEEHTAPEDHRPFGVLLESAAVQIDPAGVLTSDEGTIASLVTSHADLTELIDDELRMASFTGWVAALHRTAQGRDTGMEADFAAVRGPHSAAMQAWLASNAQAYDAVLVQGIPFDVIPSTVETLKGLPAAKRPRIVTLPHFHGDDRFYHWKRYAESFAEADATLLFSKSIADQLEPRNPYVVVPGGGIRADEHGDPAAEHSFRAVHKATNPFFLVLGRKTASKGYAQTVRAHQALRSAGHTADLVMIGPDEDGLPIRGEGVVYLGRQPRDVIRGALRLCLGLVTMSRSESFGIVVCEAWLFGKPVIANRLCYSFRELIRQDETGLLVQTDQELTQAMQHLTEDDEARSRMGRAGLDEVLEKFTWERVAEACFATSSPPLPADEPNL